MTIDSVTSLHRMYRRVVGGGEVCCLRLLCCYCETLSGSCRSGTTCSTTTPRCWRTPTAPSIHSSTRAFRPASDEVFTILLPTSISGGSVVDVCMGMWKTGIQWVSWDSHGNGSKISHGMGMGIKCMEMGGKTRELSPATVNSLLFLHSNTE